MSKNVLSTIVLALTLGIATSSFAEEQSFTVSATVPTATGVTIAASRVAAATGTFTPVTGTALNFDPLTFNSANGIFLPDHFFAIDVAATGGAGSPDVTVTYTEGANPNGAGHGLGWKSTATFVKVTGTTGAQTETGITSMGPKQMLKDLNGDTIDDTVLAGGFLRIYVGIVSKDPAAAFPDPAASEPFTPGDVPGAYNGTLVVSATVA